MQKLLRLFFYSLFVSPAFGQFPVSPDSVFRFMRYNSVFRERADWNAIEERYRSQLRTGKSPTDTARALVSVLETLNDVHSQLYLNNQYFGHYPSFPDSVLPRLRDLNQKALSETNRIRIQKLPSGMGYLRVPSMQISGSATVESLARKLADSLHRVARDAPNGLIVDLRLNGGGNLYPMLAGLSALFGSGILAFEVEPDGSRTRTWEIRKDQFYLGSYRPVLLPKYPDLRLSSRRVAVLVGPVTKSSGSMVAIAFTGRPKTRIFGEATADGYTTSCNFFRFSPNLIFNFSTHFVADRAGKVYKDFVSPQTPVSGSDQFDDILRDAKIKAALDWLTYGSE